MPFQSLDFREQPCLFLISVRSACFTERIFLRGRYETFLIRLLIPLSGTRRFQFCSAGTHYFGIIKYLPDGARTEHISLPIAGMHCFADACGNFYCRMYLLFGVSRWYE